MSDEESEYEEATPEQKLNIATYFIMSSPTGEVEEVIHDVKKLVGDDAVLSDKALSKILKNYNVDQMHSAKDPSGDGDLVVSAYGQVSDDQYVDPATGRVVKFDHRTRQFTDVTEKKQVLDDKVDVFRAAVQAATDKYVEDTYRPRKCTPVVYGADSGVVTVVLTAKNVNLGNFWTGGWRGVYSFNALEKSSSIKGNVKINVHYFEDGNVQLHSKIDKTGDISVSDPDATAASVVAAIGKIESEFQNALEEMYVKMHSSTFKQMRRFLPITRKQMNWNTAAHSLASEISK